MSNKQFFNSLKKEYESYDVGRRTIIKSSNDILKLAKEAIFSCHRDELADAEKSLNAAKKELQYLQKNIAKDRKLQFEGSLRAALEEYSEAALFFSFLKTGKLEQVKGVDLDAELYIGALSDVTGELVRKAIAYATVRNLKEVQKIKVFIEEVNGEFISFNLLSQLRSKYDQAKKNLRAVEQIMYDLSLRS